MVEVAEIESLALTVEIVIEFMGTEVELEAEFWRLNKKRMIDVQKARICVSAGR